MTQVIVDGVEYVKRREVGMPKIGIGITTRNRHAVLADTLEHVRRHLPLNAVVVIVDDASDEPVDGATFRFEENVGIARAKTKTIELLYDRGVEHFFLFDDDAYPISDDWWRPYVASSEPHLMYQFLDLAGPRKLHDIVELYRDDEHVAYSGPRGVMLYFERHVVDVVGGFDPIYDRFGYEHGDFSNRAHHEGLTTWRYADVVNSDRLIYSLDEHEAVERSFSPAERNAFVRRNAEIHNKRRETWHRSFIPFREPRNVILTSFFVKPGDPQRGFTPVDWSSFRTLELSLLGRDVVVFSDDEKSSFTIHHEVKINLYFERWIAVYQYLRAHPEIEFAWAVDATDVELLRDPFDLEKGKLYIGYEPKTLDDQWLRRNHRSMLARRFIQANRTETMLNMGVVGGDRDTLMEFAHRVLAFHFDAETTVFHKKDTESVGIGDMLAGNYVARTFFADRIVTGSEIVTKFKAYETDNEVAIWKHK